MSGCPGTVILQTFKEQVWNCKQKTATMKLPLVLLLFALPACGQNNPPQLKELEASLAKRTVSVNQVLADPAWMAYHPQTAFRELIKKHAPAGKAVMITSAEPGTRITMKCRVTNQQGQPVAGALVYAYQTSARGWYADSFAHVGGNEGDMRHARLFVYVTTDQNGEFEIATIRPAGYPQSDLPAHIHLAMWKEGKTIHDVPGELLFEEDERLTPERKNRALRDGFLVSRNTGTAEAPVYTYQFSVKL